MQLNRRIYVFTETQLQNVLKTTVDTVFAALHQNCGWDEGPAREAGPEAIKQALDTEQDLVSIGYSNPKNQVIKRDVVDINLGGCPTWISNCRN